MFVTIARDPMIRDDAGKIVAVRLKTADGDALGLADAAAANPVEFWRFAEDFRDED